MVNSENGEMSRNVSRDDAGNVVLRIYVIGKDVVDQCGSGFGNSGWFVYKWGDIVGKVNGDKVIGRRMCSMFKKVYIEVARMVYDFIFILNCI
jgi:hypothetical protein